MEREGWEDAPLGLGTGLAGMVPLAVMVFVFPPLQLAGLLASRVRLLLYSSARPAVSKTSLGFLSGRCCCNSSGQFHKNCSMVICSFSCWKVVSPSPEVHWSTVRRRALM
ncbi:hypothetical protein GDO81_006201 [Engystomops pustulosus]|uniref:Uncharacterized protein n=1 Tax=Engystomops pustulosus TaxID=76066 RepID=A0AAV7CV42_ENGPU|nr:hypothetical protein GDO81_006201 [Engystomops pustulosus]